MSMKYLPTIFQAQDMVQEVFGRVWLNRKDLPRIQHFEAWLITVTRNLLIKELRTIYPAGWQPGTATSHDPYKTLDYRELENMLQLAIGQLSPRQQEVYRLSRVEGYSHKEIAGKLGISVDVSREHMSKALQNIRSFLQTEYGMPGVLAAWIFLYNFF